jgi:flagellar protein FlaF
MGFGVSGSYAVVFLAVLVSLGTVYGVLSNTTEQVTNALDDELTRADETGRTVINITSADYRNNTLQLEVENTGDTALSVSDTDLLVDGEYVLEENRTSAVSGNGDTDGWARGQTLALSVDLPTPDRVKVVTEHGVAATAAVDLGLTANARPGTNGTLTANVAFTDSSSSLRSYGRDDQFTDYSGRATAVGPPKSDFVAGGVKEVPSVRSEGDVVVTTATGDRTVLASGAKTEFTRLSAGRWQGSNSSVFYVESGTRDILRVTSDGTTTPIEANSDIEAEGIAGLGDVDDDGADELVYGGNGPGGTSNSVVYVDDDGTVLGTQAGYGTNNGIGLGEPADFDGDGTSRVPYVDGSNDIRLVDDNGRTTKLVGGGVAAKTPMATGNFDGDDPVEIYFVGADNDDLLILDNVTVDNTVRTVTDSQGTSAAADNDAGVA